MLRIDLFKIRPLGIASAVSFLLFSAAATAASDPKCLELLKRDRERILAKFGKIQNIHTYNLQGARKVQAMAEKYLVELGVVLENFDVKIFLEEQLAKIPSVKELTRAERARLAAVLAPAFENRRMPSYATLSKQLDDAGLGRIAYRKVHDTMDRSFRIWRTKLVFDETGTATWNKLAKAFTEKQDLGEFSMSIPRLGKNQWDAFFEAEPGNAAPNGRALFNGSMPGMLSDIFGTTELHEAVHMVVETVAARGKDSPYAVWFKINPKLKSIGAVGPAQRDALLKAIDPLNDGDYYRMELYLDEFPAHQIQATLLNVQLSKAIGARFQKVVESVADPDLARELDYAYAEYLRELEVDWAKYSPKAKKRFEEFLAANADDGRTKVSKLLGEMHEFMQYINLLNDGGASAVAEARKVVDGAVAEAKRTGRTGIHPEPDGLVRIEKDVFMGFSGYRIAVHIPVDILKDGEYLAKPRPDGAVVNFRFSRGGAPTKTITRKKLERVYRRMDWVDELAAKVRTEMDAYAKYLDAHGELADYTVADVFAIKHIHTRLRRLTRETLERMRTDPNPL